MGMLSDFSYVGVFPNLSHDYTGNYGPYILLWAQITRLTQPDPPAVLENNADQGFRRLVLFRDRPIPISNRLGPVATKTYK